MENFRDTTLNQLKNLLQKEGFKPFAAAQVFNWVYKKRVENFLAMSDLSHKLRQWLKNRFYFGSIDLALCQASNDGTKKYLFRLQDGSLIESVLIPEKKRMSLCISTQVGCKFACLFCASGKKGFKRNLTPGEIVSQYLFVKAQM